MLSPKEFEKLNALKKLIVESPGTPQYGGFVYGSQTSFCPDHWSCGVDGCKACKKGDIHFCMACKSPSNHRTKFCPINNEGKFGYGGYIIVNGYQLWYCGDSTCNVNSIHHHKCKKCDKYIKIGNICFKCEEPKCSLEQANTFEQQKENYY